MAIYLVGYALLRWQFGSWVPICQSNTLVPRQVLHRSEDKDLISPAYFLEFQSIFPRIHIWYFQNSFLQVLSRARSRSWLFCLLTDWWYKRWWENHVICLGAQSFEHANVLSEKINFSALGGPKVAIFGRDDLDPIYFDVIN